MVIRCVVAGHSGDGPDLWFVAVQCSGPEYRDGQHYEAATQWASSQGIDSPMIVFDEHDRSANKLIPLFEWDTASVVDVDGDVIPDGNLISE